MRNIDHLHNLMTLDANMKSSDIEARFNQIAKKLFENFAIQKGTQLISSRRLSFTFTTKIIVILSLIHECPNHYIGTLMISEE